MKKVYLVCWSSSHFDDYPTRNEARRVFYRREQAEQAKKQLEDGYKSYDFPLDWCTADNYDTPENMDRMLQEEAELVNIWYDHEYQVQDFGSAWIEELELID